MSAVPTHFIRPNEGSRYPRRIAVFDTEAYTHETKRGGRHTFRCAVAGFNQIDPVSGLSDKGDSSAFTDPAELWRWLDSKTRAKGRLIVFAHNLAYDLRIGRAFELLPELGYRLEFITLDGSKCVARWRRGNRTIVFTDTMSFLPASLEEIGRRLGVDKLPLPDQAAPMADWIERCQRDVQITRTAALRLLRWFEDNDCGNFRLTGPAQSMACYRHRFLERYTLLAHKDEDALRAERRAAWAGRCEVFRHGQVDEPVHEWDFELAYLHLARSLYLPVRLLGEGQPMSVRQLRALSTRRCVLAEVTMSTEQPVVPASDDGRILWPVGTFQTTLWDKEIVAAYERGAEITVERSWVYRRWPALTGWADWLLGELGPDGQPAESLERLLLKHWARALVGRFGMRYPLWEKVATLPDSQLELLPYADLDSDEEGAYLQAGTDWFERSGLVDAPDALPAIMGYVMSAARVQLLGLLDYAGPHALYCDTDGLIVDDVVHHALTGVGAGRFDAAPLRHKGSYPFATLLAPRQLILGDRPRMAGVPRRAVQTADRVFEGQVWEGLAESIRRGKPNEVRVTTRRFNAKGLDRRRRHLPDGRTEPYRLG
jgi:hypothetical protein